MVIDDWSVIGDWHQAHSSRLVDPNQCCSHCCLIGEIMYRYLEGTGDRCIDGKY
jgi:hypothetical protein